MNSIYLANITAAVLLLFWPIWFSRTQLRLPWVSPFSIVLVIGLPVDFMILLGGPLALIEGGLFDSGYQFAVLMTNLLSLAQISGALVFFRFSKLIGAHRYLPFQQMFLSRRDLRLGAYFFFLIFVFSMYALARSEFGVVNWLLNPREGYQLYRAGQGHWYAIANSAISVSFVLAFLSRPTPGNLLCVTAIYLGMGYLLGSKGVLLAIFTSALVFLWFLRWRHLGKMILLGMPVIFGLMIFSLYQAIGDNIELQSIVSYFDHFKNGADYYRSYFNHELNLFQGEITLSSLWAYIPRALWPDKPWAYGITLVNEIFFPGQAELTNTPAFGGAVEQFADFGPLGVLIFGFFSIKAISTGLMSYFIFRKPGLCFNRLAMPVLILIIIQYGPAFGNFLPAALFVLLLLIIGSVLLILQFFHRYLKQIDLPTQIHSVSTSNMQ